MMDFMAVLLTIFSIKMMIGVMVLAGGFVGVILPCVYFYLRKRFQTAREKNRNGTKLQVGLFHPYCNAGGGGEKVLWVGLLALQRKYKKAEFFVYTGDVEASSEEIIQKVEKNLNVKLEKNIKFVYLTKRKWLEASMYPYFTLLGQALGSIYLAFEALNKLNPDIVLDTTGLTFILPAFKYLGGCKTGSYLHYPTITSEMLKRVSSRQAMYNNRSFIARSPFFTSAKLLYYNIFAWLYTLAGHCSDITTVNSTFTLEHLQSLWNRPIHLIYPPCETEHLKKIKHFTSKPKKVRIMSLGQFRPEKDHPLQLQALYELREIVPEEVFENITLVLCGGCRNTDDLTRVKDLKDLSKHLSLENNVEFRINISYEELLKEFESSYIGIHTMLDEHFGISVVEQMAAGLIMIAHRSGGPLLDIIETSEGSRLGFLATTSVEYAQTIKLILRTPDTIINEIRERAKASVDRFSLKKFQDEFIRAFEPLLK